MVAIGMLVAVFSRLLIQRSQCSLYLRRGCSKTTRHLSVPADDTKDPRKVHLIEWFVADQEEPVRFKAMDGELLRTAALRRGVVSPHNGRARLINCRGLGTCGTCAVDVPNSGQRNAIENVRLSLPPHGSELQPPSLRLACQVVVCQDLRVFKREGFWGQDPSKLAKRTPVKTYFGSFEFITDRTSPDEE